MSFQHENASDLTPLLTMRREMPSSKCDSRKFLRSRIPIVIWLPIYSWNKLLQDALAGLTVGLTAIPQGIAYTAVAGLPAQYGLYSSFMGCFVYIIFGSTKDLTIGPTAIMALLTQPYVANFGEDFAVLLCFLSGCVMLTLGVLHLGFLVDFISMPVISGFTNAAVIIIATTQLKSLFGINVSSDSFIRSIVVVFKHIREISVWDTLLGLTSILALVALKKLPGRRSGSPFRKLLWLMSVARNAMVVITGILLAYLLSLNGLEPFRLTGNIVEGLPPFGPPPFSSAHNNETYNFLEMTTELGSGLISTPLIAILETIAIAKAFSKGRVVDATQEMLAVGLSNIFGSFVRSMPTAGSFTRTAVNNASGVKTPMGGIFTGLLVLLACSLLTPTFRFIPKTSLAAVVMVAMYHMLELDVFCVLWRTKKMDLIPMLVTLVFCLALSLEYGMVAGILVNLILLLYFTARPGMLIEEQLIDGLVVLYVSPKQSLSFPAAEHLREEVMLRCENRTDTMPVVIDGRHVHRIDATVAKNLKLLQVDLESKNQMLIFWNWYENSKRTLTGYDSTLAAHFKTSGSLVQILSGDAWISNTSIVGNVPT